MPHVVFDEESKTGSEFETGHWRQHFQRRSNVFLMGNLAFFFRLVPNYDTEGSCVSQYGYCLFQWRRTGWPCFPTRKGFLCLLSLHIRLEVRGGAHWSLIITQPPKSTGYFLMKKSQPFLGMKRKVMGPPSGWKTKPIWSWSCDRTILMSVATSLSYSSWWTKWCINLRSLEHRYRLADRGDHHCLLTSVNLSLGGESLFSLSGGTVRGSSINRTCTF